MAAPASARVGIASAIAVAKGAAARGASPIEAAALAAATQPRQLLLDAPVGLEKALERELEDLGIRGPRSRYRGGVALEAPQVALWRAALESRVLASARLGLGRPFHAAYESTLRNHAAGINWLDYMVFGPDPVTPKIKVNVSNSRLYHTAVVERAVTSAIEEQRQKHLHKKLQRLDDRSFYGQAASGRARMPTIFVDLQDDECQLSVAATEVPHKRAYTCVEVAAEGPAVGGTLSTPVSSGLGGPHAAACVMRVQLLQQLGEVAAGGQDLVVWDPFCGRGTMLLEALGLALGAPPASPAMRLPFADFPSFDESRYGEVVRELQVRPHPQLRRLTLLGTHSDPKLVGVASSELASFLRTMPRPRLGPLSQLWSGARAEGQGSSHGLPCSVRFLEAQNLAEVLPQVRGRPTLILTNVPYGNRAPDASSYARSAYEQLGRLVREGLEPGSIRGVYCLSAREEFKRHSGLDWRTELRFQNGGIWVDLLRWTGRASDAQRAAAPVRSRRRGKS